MSKCALNHATIHTQRCTGSGGGQRAGDVRHQRGDLLGPSEALDERGGAHLLEKLPLKISKRPPTRLCKGVNELAHTSRTCRARQNAIDGNRRMLSIQRDISCRCECVPS